MLFRSPSKNSSTIADMKELELRINKDEVLDGIIDVEKIGIRDMIFYGVNVDEILMKSYTFIKDQKYKQYDTQNSTTIESMTARAIIDNQVMNVSSININSSLLSIAGSGKIDIRSKTINFDMIGKLKEKKRCFKFI